MIQIPILNIQSRKYLEFTVLQYMLDAACENPKLSRVYVDDEIKPSVCIFILKHLLFIGGEFAPEHFNYLVNEILPEQLKRNIHISFIFCQEKEWENAIKTKFADKCHQYERSLYHIKPASNAGMSGHTCINEITAGLFHSGISNLDMIRDEIIGTATYDSLDDFFIRGIGYTPVIDNKVIGFCTSEYPSKNVLAIGIEVLQEYQRQGLAKAMTQKFLHRAAQCGVDVYWECWKNNTASANTALACGFEKIADYPMLFLEL